MKYVHVQWGVNCDYILVSTDANGAEIKRNAVRQGVGRNDDVYQLAGHNMNGTQSVIGDIDVPWQHDFSMTEIHDNA